MSFAYFAWQVSGNINFYNLHNPIVTVSCAYLRFFDFTAAALTII